MEETGLLLGVSLEAEKGGKKGPGCSLPPTLGLCQVHPIGRAQLETTGV